MVCVPFGASYLSSVSERMLLIYTKEQFLGGSDACLFKLDPLKQYSEPGQGGVLLFLFEFKNYEGPS